jgi:hypothetical protein
MKTSRIGTLKCGPDLENRPVTGMRTDVAIGFEVSAATTDVLAGCLIGWSRVLRTVRAISYVIMTSFGPSVSPKAQRLVRCSVAVRLHPFPRLIPYKELFVPQFGNGPSGSGQSKGCRIGSTPKRGWPTLDARGSSACSIWHHHRRKSGRLAVTQIWR